MDYYGKEPRPYHGIGIFVFFLVLVPIATFIFVYKIIDHYDSASPQNMIIMFSLFVTGAVETLFNIISILRGIIADLIRSWFERIKNFFEDLQISLKEALKNYFTSMYLDGGIILAIFFTWMIAWIVVGVVSFINVYNWYLVYDHWA